MKIAFLNRYQNYIQRGAETFVYEICKQLSKKHKVDILVGDRADSLTEILQGDYQIVIPINGGWQSLKTSLGRIGRNYKMVISGQAGIGRGEIFNLAIAKPDLFVALTEGMQRWAKKWAWGTEVIKIPNGVDLNKFKPNSGKLNLHLKEPIILSVGALFWYKHHEKTIKALNLLKRGSLLIIGEGPEEDKLNNLGKHLLGDRFKIIKANYKDLPKFYQSADLFVLPSWEREAFGIVYLEAMACGLGIVAPNDLSRNEIIGKGGILIDVSDATLYAKAIDQALNMNWKQKVLSQASKYSWEKVAREYEKAFDDLLNKKA